jgi:hypothetical protein
MSGLRSNEEYRDRNVSPVLKKIALSDPIMAAFVSGYIRSQFGTYTEMLERALEYYSVTVNKLTQQNVKLQQMQPMVIQIESKNFVQKEDHEQTQQA